MLHSPNVHTRSLLAWRWLTFSIAVRRSHVVLPTFAWWGRWRCTYYDQLWRYQRRIADLKLTIIVLLSIAQMAIIKKDTVLALWVFFFYQIRSETLKFWLKVTCGVWWILVAENGSVTINFSKRNTVQIPFLFNLWLDAVHLKKHEEHTAGQNLVIKNKDLSYDNSLK